MRRTLAVLVTTAAFLVPAAAASASPGVHDGGPGKGSHSKDKADAPAKKAKPGKDAKADSSASSSRCTDFSFTYRSGLVDAGQFCGGNDVTNQDLPLNANWLHISCSDVFNADGTASKSDLNGQVISHYTITKSDGKTCSETFDPTATAEVEVEEAEESVPGRGSNASCNNGKGGNYAWTGHTDNGNGNGKGRAAGGCDSAPVVDDGDDDSDDDSDDDVDDGVDDDPTPDPEPEPILEEGEF